MGVPTFSVWRSFSTSCSSGRHHFAASHARRSCPKIIAEEPRPPRQIDDKIPRELERICLKALSKRAAERYSTAKDLADDLRHFLSTRGRGMQSNRLAAELADRDSADGDRRKNGARNPTAEFCCSAPIRSGRPITIVPRGLSSFDEHDADFFLELLPGPRDRNGLPDGLRFWKARIEATDPDKTFRVGIIYGPSGCGKSSLDQGRACFRCSNRNTA